MLKSAAGVGFRALALTRLRANPDTVHTAMPYNVHLPCILLFRLEIAQQGIDSMEVHDNITS